eukprot:gene7630-15617_t
MLRDVLVLLRLIDNRLCADCDAPLGETTISGSCLYGTWICEECTKVHKELRGSKPKLALDNWEESEIKIMQNARNNNKVNQIYERYIPNGWTKCGPDASFEDRQLWIKAKYEMKMFVLPEKKKGKDSFASSTIKSPPSSLPVRIIDFFLVISPGTCKQYKMKELSDNISPENITFVPTISSCCPAPDFYKDLLLPDNVGPFVYPNGVHLSSIERAPYFFTFVLTDVSGIKMYGASLHVYELVEPEELAVMLGHSIGSPQFPKWPIVFAPKALTILSHYAFYNLYREYLEQLYRISLSSSPIPLERYIVNFVHEVPLPPQGQIEINFALADRTVCISRPPKNRLPMIDFSYRPLFTCLSVDTILYVFSALCTESKVCICSDNTALLTPVQEALLSLLFPLVWQGAYIPVIPDHICEDILDAPVPIFVGLYGGFLKKPDEINRHPGIIFVDIDNDKIILGKDESGRPCPPPPPLPHRDEMKLKLKLIQYGGCIYKQKKYPPAGIAFPRREHLTPIRVFASEEGVTYQRARSLTKGGGTSSNSKKSASKVALTNHPIVCSKSSIGSATILDPNNNIGTSDEFNAGEIRGAFLRFFVSILRDYEKYVISNGNGYFDYSDTTSSASTMRTIPSRTTFDRPSLLSKSPFLIAM